MFQFKVQQTRMHQNVRDYKGEERRGVWQYTLEPATLPDREYQNDIPTVLQGKKKKLTSLSILSDIRKIFNTHTY